MKRLATIAVIVLLGAAVVIGGIWLTGVRNDDARPAETADSSIPPRPAEAFALTVTYVFDGDTIEARVHSPNETVPTTDPIRIRLLGIDTPEGTPTPECWADEARTHLSTLLPEGATVWATPDQEWRDRYGRLLLYLWTDDTDDGRFINHELVAAGDAEAIKVGPNDAHFPLLAETQQTAQDAGAGQWGAC